METQIGGMKGCQEEAPPTEVGSGFIGEWLTAQLKLRPFKYP